MRCITNIAKFKIFQNKLSTKRNICHFNQKTFNSLLEPPPVFNFSAYPQDARLMVEWEPPTSTKVVSSYIIEWCEVFTKDLCREPLYWQGEQKTVKKTFLKGV